MKIFAVLATVLAFGCAAGASPKSETVLLSLDPQRGRTEQNVARNLERFLQINEPLMEHPLRVVWGGPETEAYLAVVRPRLSSDMELKQLNLSAGELIYAVLVRSVLQDYIYILRIDRVDGTGAYRSLPGLIYTFDRPSGIIRSVQSSFY